MHLSFVWIMILLLSIALLIFALLLRGAAETPEEKLLEDAIQSEYLKLYQERKKKKT